MLRMDQVHVVRYKVLVEGQSVRRVAREMGISRNTVRKYLKVSEPVRREQGPRARPVLEKVAPRIGELLEEWSTRTTPSGGVVSRTGYYTPQATNHRHPAPSAID